MTAVDPAKLKEVFPNCSQDFLDNNCNPIQSSKIVPPCHDKAKGIHPVRSGKERPPRAFAVKIEYPGSFISVNHYKFAGGRYTRPEAKHWMNSLGWLLAEQYVDWSKLKLPLEVRCDACFKDGRHPDLSNLSKVILDTIQRVSGINDKYMRWQDGNITFGDYPALIITIKES